MVVAHVERGYDSYYMRRWEKSGMERNSRMEVVLCGMDMTMIVDNSRMKKSPISDGEREDKVSLRDKCWNGQLGGDVGRREWRGRKCRMS